MHIQNLRHTDSMLNSSITHAKEKTKQNLVTVHSCSYIHSHKYTDGGDDATFHQMFLLIQLSKTAAAGPPQYNARSQSAPSHTRPITYVHNNALTYTHCTDTYIYWKSTVCISLCSVCQTVYFLQKKVKHFLFFSCISVMHMWSPHWGKYRLSWESMCVCGVGNRPKEPICDLT